MLTPVVDLEGGERLDLRFTPELRA
jgi:hypothetical protein